MGYLYLYILASISIGLLGLMHFVTFGTAKTPIVNMAPDTTANVVNADCVHIRWLDTLVLSCLIHMVDRFMIEG